MVREPRERKEPGDDHMATPTAAEAANGFCYPDHQPAAGAHLVGQIPPGYHQGADTIFSNLMAVNNGSANWQESEATSTGFVFPCGSNERPSQGLSLSLSSADPLPIGLQPFQLRPLSNNQDHNQEIGFGSTGLRDHHHQHHGLVFGKSPLLQGQVGQFQLRSSKYLGPVQELLNEFCSLGTHSTKQQSNNDQTQTMQKTQKPDKKREEDNNGSNVSSSSSAKNQPLSALELMELQKRKAKLLSLLDEVCICSQSCSLSLSSPSFTCLPLFRIEESQHAFHLMIIYTN